MMNDCRVFSFAAKEIRADPSFHRVGDSAKNAFHSNPTNTVFDAKRLIGRKMDDLELKRDMKHFPFNIVDKGGKPAISIGYKGDTRQFVSHQDQTSDVLLTAFFRLQRRLVL
jgi:molecular chaperone DnaK (HSP70)